MPYIINTYNGQQIAVVNDGTVDNTTDIKIVGKNYAGFGEIINENFVHLLESFAGATQPPRPLPGQVWYDSANRVIKFYDGNRFRIAGGAEIGANAPTGLAVGDLWWETDGEQLYVYNGEDFILVGPIATGGEGVSQLTAATVKDISANDRTILKVTVQDEVIGVIAKDEFTLNSTLNPIAGFSAIKKGFNLASEVTIPGIRYHGIAADSDNLGGIPASQYVLNSGLQSFADLVKFLNDEGLTVGNGQDLKLHITNGDHGNISNQVGSILNFRVNTGTGAVTVGSFNNNTFLPQANGVGTIGSVSNKWATIYADNYVAGSGVFTGNLVGNVSGNLNGNTSGDHTGNVSASSGTSTFNNVTVNGTLNATVTGTTDVATKLVVDSGTAREAATLLVSNTVVARDGSGNINVNVMNGTATDAQALNGAVADTAATSGSIAQRDTNKDLTARKFLGTATAAQFADLAENYLADADYEIGTVLILGGEAEVTQSTSQMDSRVVGVVSENPAHLMNSNLQGDNIAPVALRGRVQVKVTGPVRKGDILITSHIPGTATALTEDSAIPNAVYIIGKAIESSTDSNTKLIEVVV